MPLRTALRGTVKPLPVGKTTERLRLTLSRIDLDENARVVEDTIIGDPVAVRALFDASVPIAEARAYADVLRGLAEDIEREVRTYEVLTGKKS